MDGKVRGEIRGVPGAPVFEVKVDPALDEQIVGAGLTIFWWTTDDGTREGALCEIEYCPFPMCPCREATVHAIRVGPELTRVWVDGEHRYHADGEEGPIDLDQEERRASILVTFEPDDRRVGPASGDCELVRRLHKVLDGRMVRVIETYWELLRRGNPASKLAVEPGRNAPCPCGSGKKYKKCCLARGIRIQRLPQGVESVLPYFPNGGEASGSGVH